MIVVVVEVVVEVVNQIYQKILYFVAWWQNSIFVAYCLSYTYGLS